jgi:hypothetical protein
MRSLTVECNGHRKTEGFEVGAFMRSLHNVLKIDSGTVLLFKLTIL